MNYKGGQHVPEWQLLTLGSACSGMGAVGGIYSLFAKAGRFKELKTEFIQKVFGRSLANLAAV